MKIKKHLGIKTDFNKLEIGDIYCYHDDDDCYFMLIEDVDEGEKIISIPDGYIQKTLGDPDREVIKLDCELWVK